MTLALIMQTATEMLQPKRTSIVRRSARRLLRAKTVSVAVILVAGCGGGSGSAPVTPTAPSPAPPAAPAPAVVTIGGSGVSPRELTIAVGGRVTFVNNDIVPHDMAGGPDPAHPDCPEIDVVGFLTPGQQRATGAFTVARTCEYHDHSFHSAIMTGRIVIR
jgi:plastocyanin